MTPKNFGQVSAGRDNNFDFLRFFFASLVIVSHSYSFLRGGRLDGYDPLCHLSRGQTAFGGLSVYCFFLISGFLITKSWLSSRGVGDYAKKRLLRIMPGLIVVLAFCVFVIGPLAVADRAAYFHDPLTYRYFGFMLTKNLHLHDRLPGVFLHNPEQFRVDGSLWTIRVEMLCYAMVAILGLLQAYRKPFVVTALTLAALGVTVLQARHPQVAGGAEGVFSVAVYFLVGMTFFLNRDRIPYSPGLLLLSLLALAASDRLGVLALTQPILAAYVLFYLAFSPALRLHHFGKNGDFSYGIYLYAFPIQQLLVQWLRPAFTPITLALASLAVTFVFAFLSWHLVEKPFLRLKKKPKMEAPNVPEAPPVAVPMGVTVP